MAEIKLDYSVSEINEAITKVKNVESSALLDTDLSNISEEGKKVLESYGNSEGAADVLDTEGAIKEELLPDSALCVSEMKYGLNISTPSNSKISVSKGQTMDSTGTKLLKLDSTISKITEVFGTGDNKGGQSTISGPQINKTYPTNGTRVTVSLISAYGSVSENSYKTLTSHNFPQPLPEGVTYTVTVNMDKGYMASYNYFRVKLTHTDSTVTTLFDSMITTNFKKTFTVTPTVPIRNISVTGAFKKSTSNQYSESSSYVCIYGLEITAPVVNEAPVFIIGKEDGKTDVCMGAKLPDGYQYKKQIGRITYSSDGYIADYFPKNSISEISSNYDIATKDDIGALRTTITTLQDTVATLTAKIEALENIKGE